jgi:hypothetical protein
VANNFCRLAANPLELLFFQEKESKKLSIKKA